MLDTQDDGYAGYLDTINDLADEHDAAEIAAAILKLYAEETGRTTTPEQREDDIATFAAVAPPARGPRGEAGMVRLFLNVGRNQGAAGISSAPSRTRPGSLGAPSAPSTSSTTTPSSISPASSSTASWRRCAAPGSRDARSTPRSRVWMVLRVRGTAAAGAGPSGRPPFVGGGRVNRDGDNRPPRRYERSDRPERSGSPRFRTRRDR